jgi:hypothetical protein
VRIDRPTPLVGTLWRPPGATVTVKGAKDSGARVATLGHVPGRLSGLGAGLPRGVCRQWRCWCLRRGFTDADPARGRPDGGARPHPTL